MTTTPTPPASSAPRCYGRVVGRGFVQEWYETAARDAGRRARELRALGFAVSVCSMGEQVTEVGRVRMTLLSVRGADVDVPTDGIRRS